METQRTQKLVLNDIKQAKEYDSMKHNSPEHDNGDHKKLKSGEVLILWDWASPETVPCI